MIARLLFFLLLGIPTLSWSQRPPVEWDTLGLTEREALIITTYNSAQFNQPPRLEINIIDTLSGQILYTENKLELEKSYLFGKARHSMGGYPAALIELHPGGIGRGSMLLIVMAGDSVISASFETAGYYEFIDLDEDEQKELLLTDHLYYRLNVNGCTNEKAPDPTFAGRLTPRIYQLTRNRELQRIRDSKELEVYYESYALYLENEVLGIDSIPRILHYKDYSQPEAPSLLDYSQYYHLCNLSDLGRKHALNFFLRSDKSFNYICENEFGIAFSLESTLYQFFRRFGKEINDPPFQTE